MFHLLSLEENMSLQAADQEQVWNRSSSSWIPFNFWTDVGASLSATFILAVYANFLSPICHYYISILLLILIMMLTYFVLYCSKCYYKFKIVSHSDLEVSQYRESVWEKFPIWTFRLTWRVSLVKKYCLDKLSRKMPTLHDRCSNNDLLRNIYLIRESYNTEICKSISKGELWGTKFDSEIIITLVLLFLVYILQLFCPKICLRIDNFYSHKINERTL